MMHKRVPQAAAFQIKVKGKSEQLAKHTPDFASEMEINMIKQGLKKMILAGYRLMTYVLPLNQNIIVFQSSLGRNYTGSPRAVFEKMVEFGLDKNIAATIF